jgi:dTDP-4-amino-4,6-dideoxygalactose transaminase
MRRAVAQQYDRDIFNPGIIKPSHPADPNEHVWHLYVVRTENRDALQQHLADNGVETLIHYPIPPDKQRAYEGFRDSTLVVAEELAHRVLSIPMHHLLSQQDVETVASLLSA